MGDNYGKGSRKIYFVPVTEQSSLDSAFAIAHFFGPPCADLSTCQVFRNFDPFITGKIGLVSVPAYKIVGSPLRFSDLPFQELAAPENALREERVGVGVVEVLLPR